MKRIIKAPSILFILLLTVLFATNTYSGENHISYLEGDVTVIQEGNEIEADFGTELSDGDIIITGEDGLAILELSNARILKMKEKSVLTMEDSSLKAEFKLSSGSLFAKVGKLTGGSFTVRTDSVVAGVRGTEFFISYGLAVEEEPDIWLCVNEGAVEVGLSKTGESVLVKEGEGINIFSGNRLSDPQFFSWTRDLNWNLDPSYGSVRDDTSVEDIYTDLLDQDYF